MKEEINNLKNKNNTITGNNNDRLNTNLNIHNNIVEHYKKTMDKNPMDNLVNIQLKYGLKNNQSNSSIHNIESNKNNQI